MRRRSRTCPPGNARCAPDRPALKRGKSTAREVEPVESIPDDAPKRVASRVTFPQNRVAGRQVFCRNSGFCVNFARTTPSIIPIFTSSQSGRGLTRRPNRFAAPGVAVVKRRFSFPERLFAPETTPSIRTNLFFRNDIYYRQRKGAGRPPPSLATFSNASPTPLPFQSLFPLKNNFFPLSSFFRSFQPKSYRPALENRRADVYNIIDGKFADDADVFATAKTAKSTQTAFFPPLSLLRNLRRSPFYADVLAFRFSRFSSAPNRRVRRNPLGSPPDRQETRRRSG